MERDRVPEGAPADFSFGRKTARERNACCGYRSAVVLTGGECDTDKVLERNLLPADAFILAADSGYLKSESLGLTPHILVGDFDSIPTEKMPVDGLEIVRVPCEKDETDTMLACNIAVERGCREILIVGGFGGRCDHELSNIFWLESMLNRGARTAMTDGNGIIRVIRNETVEIARHEGYFSVFALDSCVVSLRGCKYPLDRAVLTRSLPYAVSNEITADCAEITIEGTALLCDIYPD